MGDAAAARRAQVPADPDVAPVVPAELAAARRDRGSDGLWGLIVPETIAYAGLAGLPPQAGLYTVLATLAAYAIFGTSRHLVASATSAAAVLLAAGNANLGPSSTSVYASRAAVMVLFCGGLFLLAGFLRLGFIAQFISVPVMAGFVFGLAVFVTVSQLPKLFGIEKGRGNTVHQFFYLLGHLGDTSWATFAIGLGALVLLFGIDRYAPRVPGGLLALVLGIVVSAHSISRHAASPSCRASCRPSPSRTSPPATSCR
jgi:sulfate permease, SulP family